MLGADPDGITDGHRAALQAPGERLSLEVLHHEEWQPLVLADVVNGADVWM